MGAPDDDDFFSALVHELDLFDPSEFGAAEPRHVEEAIATRRLLLERTIVPLVRDDIVRGVGPDMLQTWIEALDAITVRVVRSASWSATTFADDGRYLVLVDDATLHTIYLLAKLAVLPEAATEWNVALRRYLRVYFAGYQLTGRLARPGARIVVDPDLADAAMSLTEEAERFLITHELAHVVRGHLPDDGAVRELATSRMQEIEADSSALLMSLSPGLGLTGTDRIRRAAGGRLLIAAAGLVESAYRVLHSPTHPAAAERLAWYDGQLEVVMGARVSLPRHVETLIADAAGRQLRRPYDRSLREEFAACPFLELDDSVSEHDWRVLDHVEEFDRRLDRAVPLLLVETMQALDHAALEQQPQAIQRYWHGVAKRQVEYLHERPDLISRARDQAPELDWEEAHEDDVAMTARTLYFAHAGAHELPRLMTTAARKIATAREAQGLADRTDDLDWRGVTYRELQLALDEILPEASVLAVAATIRSVLRNPDHERLLAITRAMGEDAGSSPEDSGPGQSPG